MNLKYKQIEDKPNVPPFKFKPRKHTLDWKVINEVNLNQVIEGNNITPLNPLITNVTYSNLFKDDLKNYPEALVVKLIRVLQLSLEYTLYAQSVLKKNNDFLTDKYMLLWNQSEEMEKQNNKLSKAYNEVKNQLRMEKKMSRVYEFMVNKTGTLQGHELELIDAMKHSLGDGSEGKLDAKFESLVKQKESQAREIEQLRVTIDDLKKNNNNERTNYIKAVENMTGNFENLRASMSQEQNTKLQEMQSNLTNTLTEKMKLEYLDETIKKLNSNFEQMSTQALDHTRGRDDSQMLQLQSTIHELSSQIRKEQEEKALIKSEMIMLKNKVDQESKKEGASKDELTGLKKRQEDLARRLEENKRVIEENNSTSVSQRELIQRLTMENQELKMRIEDGSSDQNRLRLDLNKIEENQQNHILKIHERMQTIESTSQPELRTNCEVLESDDFSNVRMSLKDSRESNEKPFSRSTENLNQKIALDQIQTNPNASKQEKADALESSQDMSWDLSNTNISLQEKGERPEKLDTIREEKHGGAVDESVNKPRFEGNQYNDHDDKESIAEEEDTANLVEAVKVDKIDLEVVQESQAVIKKLTLNKITLKLCKGPVSDELCPVVVNYLDEYKRLVNFNINKINLIEDDIKSNAIETKKPENQFAITKSYQMPSICKVSKLVSIQLAAWDLGNLVPQCELFTSVTQQALKALDAPNVCLYLNHPTMPVDLQIQLACDVLLRVVNFNLKISTISLLVNKKQNERILEDAFYIVQNSMLGTVYEPKNDLNPEIKEKILANWGGSKATADLGNTKKITELDKDDLTYRSMNSDDATNKIDMRQSTQTLTSKNPSKEVGGSKPKYLKSLESNGYQTFSE